VRGDHEKRFPALRWPMVIAPEWKGPDPARSVQSRSDEDLCACNRNLDAGRGRRREAAHVLGGAALPERVGWNNRKENQPAVA